MSEGRSITVTLNKAKEWYNSNNKSLKEIALQAFTEKELTTKSFRDITTFKEAVEALNLNYYVISGICIEIAKTSKASAAVFKLNIVKKALNLGYELELTKSPKDSYIWYPCNPFITEDSTSYSSELKLKEMEVIGHIKIKDTLYSVLGGLAYYGGGEGLSYFYSHNGVGYANASVAFLGCANEEIAKHFGMYFGMFITEAKFGDVKDFEIAFEV